MGGWLQVCNAADVAPFIETFRRMADHYYLDKIDVSKDAVIIPGTYDICAKQVLLKKPKA